MNFVFQPSENNDIMHYAAGTQKAGAKYTKRELVNGKWKYYYGNEKTTTKKQTKYTKRELVNGKWKYYYGTTKDTSNVTNDNNISKENTTNKKDYSSGNYKDWEKALYPSMDKLFEDEPNLLNKKNFPNEAAWGNYVVGKIGQILNQHADLFNPDRYSPQEIAEMKQKTMAHFAEILSGANKSTNTSSTRIKNTKTKTKTKTKTNNTKTTESNTTSKKYKISVKKKSELSKNLNDGKRKKSSKTNVSKK